MSGTCSLFPPFGDPRPSCLLPTHKQHKLSDSQREGGKKEEERERENFPVRSSNLRHCQTRSQNKGLSLTRGELSGCRPAHSPPEAGRQVGRSQSQKARGKLGPRDGILYQTASRLPVANNWNPGQLTSIRTVAARDHLPRGDTRDT